MERLSRLKSSDKTNLLAPIRLSPIFRERVWGRTSLAPYFTGPEEDGTGPTHETSALKKHIGEVWFTYETNRTNLGKSLGEIIVEHPEILGDAWDPKHPGICPLLVKLLFTTERLSVQVHPGDDYAEAWEHSLGKTEAWYVLESRAPGEVAIGFKQELTAEKLRETAQSGELERLLDWRKAQEGDVIFVPAGTVHAIGAGLTVCEVQENSDVTYRLYDYGRGRELHLDRGVAVSRLEPYSYEANPVRLAEGRDELLACEYFRIERLRPTGEIRVPAGLPHYLILICTKGQGSLGGVEAKAGEAWLVPAGGEDFVVDAPASEWILTYTAAESIALG